MKILEKGQRISAVKHRTGKGLERLLISCRILVLQDVVILELGGDGLQDLDSLILHETTWHLKVVNYAWLHAIQILPQK